MSKISKIGNEIIWYLYHNSNADIKCLQWIGMTKRTKKVIQTNIDKLVSEGLVESTWYSRIPIFSHDRFETIHYQLTDKGWDIAENMPCIVRAREEKEREYEEDARRRYRNPRTKN